MPRARAGAARCACPDIQAGYDLVYELLFETKLDDADEILKRVSNIKNSLKKTLISSSYSVMLYRAMSAVDATTAYFNYATYLDYYDFLCAAEEALAADPESVLAQLKAVQEYFFNRTGAIAGFVGNEESAQVNRAAATDFLMKLDEKPIEKAEYDFGTRPASEALIVDGNVNYNLLFAGWDALGLEGYDGAMDAVTAYVSDVYLYPLLRDQYGAYGVIHYASDSGVYVISYRDPNLTETFQVYASLPELIKQDDPDQETLNGYIQSAYSSYALSKGLPFSSVPKRSRDISMPSCFSAQARSRCAPRLRRLSEAIFSSPIFSRRAGRAQESARAKTVSSVSALTSSAYSLIPPVTSAAPFRPSNERIV